MKFCTECLRTASDEHGMCPYEGCHGTLRLEALLGSTLEGKYAVEGVHGAGGVGVLLRARHVLLDAPVAVKVLDLRDAEADIAVDMTMRFRNEATIIAKLKHPSIVEIIDFGVASDGRSYIVMEFLEGHDLEQEIDVARPIAASRIGWVLRQVCDALEWVHGHGVIHRDIKPANIMVTRLGGEELVKVLDFGVAKIVADGAGAISRTNVVIGTPEYMAPEQIQPTLGDVGPATDVYALGVTLYEMVAGRTPFHHKTFLRICQHKLAERFKPLSQIRPGDGYEALDEVVARALARDPSRRQTSARQFFSEVEAALARVGVAASRSSVELRPIVVLDGADAAGFGDQPTAVTRPEGLGAGGANCPRCGAPLDSALQLCMLCGATGVAPRDILLGAVVGGRFEVVEALRRDELGACYRALDRREGGRAVELTLVPLDTAAAPRLVEVFDSETKRGLTLRHQGLVASIDGGFDESLRVGYVATELLEGVSLDEETVLCGLPEVGLVRRRVLEVLDTLAYLHDRDIVYGAVQPGNVIVVRHEDAERLVLIDLSRARWASTASLMVTLGRFGAPQYRCPEALWSEAPIDARADVYGIGAVAYYLLTGRAPFQEPTAQRVLERMRAGRLLSPMSIAPERVSPEWEAIVLRAMSRQPEDRFESASQMADAVGALS